MRIERLQALAALAASMAMLASPIAWATSPTTPQGVHPADIALRDGGVLTGQIVDVRGAPLQNAPVALLAGGKEVVRVASNPQGVFEIQGLKGGVYQVSTSGHQGVYRLWAPRTAPPVATQGMLIVAPGEVTLGQYPPPPGPFSTAMGWVAQHPIMTAGIIGTAIAVPLALADDDDPAS